MDSLLRLLGLVNAFALVICKNNKAQTSRIRIRSVPVALGAVAARYEGPMKNCPIGLRKSCG